ncbi:MAG: AAA family ATPase [Planctomycetota bacterium]|jgi:MoxR-like ATPase
MTDVVAIAERIKEKSQTLQAVRRGLHEVIVGQDELLDGLLIALLADGHVLLEGLPGLAKSLAVSSLAQVVGADFNRIQFTPDLLPSDLIGTQVYNPKTGDWSVKQGPVFTNFILADEINRAPAKVQSALLEAMQERQVSLAGTSHRLPNPFLVLATQNPVEQEGTYPLPEAQVDRFMLKLVVGYPSKDEEKAIIDRMGSIGSQPEVTAAMKIEELLELRKLMDTIYVDEKVKSYVVDLVFATRSPEEINLPELGPLLLYGASPRASLALTRAGRARAFLEGRGFVTPQDIKAVGLSVLRHRVIPSYEAEAEEKTSEDILRQIFDHVPVP